MYFISKIGPIENNFCRFEVVLVINTNYFILTTTAVQIMCNRQTENA